MKRPAFAGWWTDSLVLRSLCTATLGLTGCADFWVSPPPTTQLSSTEVQDENVESLVLQQRMGWHVGTEEADLELDDATRQDVLGSERWMALRTRLAEVLAPRSPSLLPFYTPTLFQSLAATSAADLLEQLEPIWTYAMRDAFDRARALLGQLDAAGFPADTALILDLPGPESVAAAAMLGDLYDPVFGFGNWPHPAGVVPAHTTLAAALYFAPMFEQQRAARLPGAPPLFVLDANRLASYSDDSEAFDNRYAARLPTVDALKQLGIRHVLYVTEAGLRELDDLNDTFVELEQGGIEVRMVGLADIVHSSIAPTAEEQEEDPELFVVDSFGGFLYWGGSVATHCSFWHRLGWPSRQRIVPPPAAAFAVHGPGSGDWRALARHTIFHGGQTRTASGTPLTHHPGAFAHTGIRTSRSSGHFVGFRAGSFGRSWGGHSA